MKSLQSVILLFSIAVLFIGTTVGADVFKHTCKSEGTLSVAYIVNSDPQCEMEHNTISNCCKSEKEKNKKDCCDDEVEHFQFQLDFSQDIIPFYFSHLSAIIVPDNEFDSLSLNRELEIGVLNYSNPPPLIGSDFRSLYQVYII